MECILSQQYLSYSPAERRAGPGKPASEASVSAVAKPSPPGRPPATQQLHTYRESNQ